MVKGKIDCFRLRYIVPFSFDCKGKDFDSYCNQVAAMSDWSIAPESESESDVYEYVKTTLIHKENKSNAGRAFSYTKKDGHGRILRIAYCENGDDKYTEVDITEAGMYLFRTGIGLFWYEVCINDKSIDVYWLIRFQYKFKELNARYNAKVFYHIIADSVRVMKGAELPLYDIELGNTVVRKKNEEFTKFTACARFSLGSWISEVVGGALSKVKYFPERDNIMMHIESKVTTTNYKQVPDKAILFSYLVVDVAKGDDEAIVQTAYYLTNGYKESYLMIPEMESQMYKPFKDAYWYATKEGCGYFVKTNTENKSFFTANMKSKVVEDYFRLYILLLHQSYTLLHFTGRIEEDLSAEAVDYQDSSSRFADKLEKLKTDINVFLVKSVYASVSHVQHQNDFYEYAERQLRVKEDIRSINTGLEALIDLQNIRLKEREERERELTEDKKQVENDSLSIGLSVISLFAIFSAFADGIAFVDKIIEYNNFSLLNDYPVILYGIVIVAIVIISLYTVVRLIQASIRSHKNKKDLKKKEEEIKNEIH